MFQGVDCGPLSAPENGNVVFSNGTIFSSFATYSCTPPTQLIGPSVRACQGTGLWSGTDPTCESLRCPTLIAPEDGSVFQTGSLPGSVGTYSCSSGFTLVGPASVTCLNNGFWSSTTPQCQRTNHSLFRDHSYGPALPKNITCCMQ